MLYCILFGSGYPNNLNIMKWHRLLAEDSAELTAHIFPGRGIATDPGVQMRPCCSMAFSRPFAVYGNVGIPKDYGFFRYMPFTTRYKLIPGTEQDIKG